MTLKNRPQLAQSDDLNELSISASTPESEKSG
jgi:hypothetical protein